MIGDPFFASVNLEQCTFIVGNLTETFTQAVEVGALDGSVYAYNQGSNSYSTVSSLSTGFGCWIYAYGAGTLMVPPP
jgi:hypothetical protein